MGYVSSQLTFLFLICFLTSKCFCWKLIVKQDAQAEIPVFPASAKDTLLYNEDDPLALPFMDIGNINWNEIPYPYEFMYIASGSGAVVTPRFTWTQTSILSTEVGTPSGYNCTSGSDGDGICPPTGFDGHSFNGLAFSDNAACIFDGDGDVNINWWGCAGSLALLENAFPTTESRVAQGVQVYLQDGSTENDFALGIVNQPEAELPSHWTKIAHQTIDATHSTGAFDADTKNTLLENEDSPDANPFMSIGNIDWDLYPPPYHFLVQWNAGNRSFPIDVWYEWTQNTSLTPSITEAVGYQCVAGNCPLVASASDGYGFDGLAFSQVHYAIFQGPLGPTQAYFHAVGALSYTGAALAGCEDGIPGPFGYFFETSTLYLDTGYVPTAAPTASPNMTAGDSVSNPPDSESETTAQNDTVALPSTEVDLDAFEGSSVNAVDQDMITMFFSGASRSGMSDGMTLITLVMCFLTLSLTHGVGL